MLTNIATVAAIAAVIGFTYWLGMAQGRYLERSRERREVGKLRWMLAEAVWRWGPWTATPQEIIAKLAADHEAKDRKAATS